MKNFIKKNPLPVVLFTIFIDLIGYGILIPVIPQLLANAHSPFYIMPEGYTVKHGYIVLGFLIGIFPLMQFFAAPILGQLSDMYGRKKILGISLVGTCLSYILFGIGILTKNIPLLFLSRALDGVTGGNISVAQAAIADVTVPENRVKNFGLIGAAFGLGFIFGPYIGGKLADPSIVSWFHSSTPFWFAAILSFLNIISVILFFPETLKNPQTHLKIDWSQSIKNIIKAFNFKPLRLIFTIMFLFWGGFTFYTTFFSVYLINKFNFTQSNIGDFFAYVGIWIAFTQIVVTRFMARHFKEEAILKYSLIVSGIAIAFYFLPDTWLGLFIITPFFAIPNGLTMANSTAIISKSADANIQGEVLGIGASVQALGQAVPPILSGFIAASITANAPIIISSIIITATGLVFAIFYRPKFS